MFAKGWALWRAAFLAFAASLALAGCAANTSPTDSSPDEIQRAVYRHDGPPALTLFTMVSNRSGAGAHTSLMVNASQRVIFDPAGSVRHSAVPESGDVLYGITPRIEAFYESAHARATYHVIVQQIEVSPAVAEQALRLVQDNGAVGQTFCTQSTSSILRKLPGFEDMPATFFPLKLSQSFAKLPGVTSRTIYENDSDDKQLAIEAFTVAPPAADS
nr:hypothetical protein [Puniceibacterium sp. IMCC21224]